MSAKIPVLPAFFIVLSIISKSSLSWLFLTKLERSWVAVIIVCRASLFFPNKPSIASLWIPVSSDNLTGLFNLNTSSAADFPTKKSGTLKAGSPLFANLKPLSKEIFVLAITLLIVCSSSASDNLGFTPVSPSTDSWYTFWKETLASFIAWAVIG